MKYELSAEMVQRIIFTLKQMDVRGYDSMDKLVGLVMLFEGLQPVMPPEPTNIMPVHEVKQEGE